MGYAAMCFVTAMLRHFTPDIAAFMEGQHGALTAAIFPALALLILGPVLFVNWSDKTWLRRSYPDVIALSWNRDGVIFEGHGLIPWSCIKIISVTDYGKMRNRRICFTLKPDPQAPSRPEEFIMPWAKLRDREATLAVLETAARAQFVPFAGGIRHVKARLKQQKKPAYQPYWKATPPR